MDVIGCWSSICSNMKESRQQLALHGRLAVLLAFVLLLPYIVVCIDASDAVRLRVLRMTSDHGALLLLRLLALVTSRFDQHDTFGEPRAKNLANHFQRICLEHWLSKGLKACQRRGSAHSHACALSLQRCAWCPCLRCQASFADSVSTPVLELFPALLIFRFHQTPCRILQSELTERW